MKISAQWIWARQENESTYNWTIMAVREFSAKDVKRATLIITADSYYRLFLNADWICDGPCRSWPEHFKYDVVDITPNILNGKNKISIIAKYFGIGTMHQIPQHPGVLVQLDIERKDGTKERIVSDGDWNVAEAKGWLRNTPKISIQQGPYELYDARLENSLSFSKAEVVCGAHEGAWKNLAPRDCPKLTTEPRSFKRYLGANIVEKKWRSYLFPLARLCHPELVEANGGTCMACALATTISSRRKKTILIQAPAFRISLNGQEVKDGALELITGKNLMFCIVRPENYFSHVKEAGIRFVDTEGFSLENPMAPGEANPWCFIPIAESSYATNDMVFPWFHPNPERDEVMKKARRKLEEMFDVVKDVDSFRKVCGENVQILPPDSMMVHASHWQFMEREVIGDAESYIAHPAALMYDTDEMMVIKPPRSGDIEIIYDLGEQNIGFYDFELFAENGLILDIYGIEYISQDGRIQHTFGTRNGMRYICKEGLNRFTSLKRRSGRFLYITLRNQTKPVSIRKIQLMESTYPVNYIGGFSCGDALLTRIWEISARTLKLCMEDTYTDCPLYEQTHWVGDARNEALYGYGVFAATDLARRCIMLGAESLERFPIVGCQVPSSWEVLLPAWAFLWGISVWDYYFFTGDRKFVKRLWKPVLKNLKGAHEFLDIHGLFSAPFWNMFDWTNIDDKHKTVLHNSMLLVGAVNAALRLADIVKDEKNKSWLQNFRRNLVKNINRFWDDNKQAYPDSIHDDGTISNKVSQHTSFLAVLYDIATGKNLKAAIKNMVHPPRSMTTVGSPFAIQYLYEALEKVGLHNEIIKMIYAKYGIMVREGATTVWETFEPLDSIPGNFPTRSHCHAWSSSPVYFLNRIILGVRQTAPGSAEYEVSPRLNGLQWARGSTASMKGRIDVEWEIKKKILIISLKSPEDIKVRFVRNDTHNGMQVLFNGQRV